MRIISLTVVIAALAIVPIAAGDGIYHSQHIPFSPLTAGSSGSGFVENIHANGPNVFAPAARRSSVETGRSSRRGICSSLPG